MASAPAASQIACYSDAHQCRADSHSRLWVLDAVAPHCRWICDESGVVFGYPRLERVGVWVLVGFGTKSRQQGVLRTVK